MYVVLLVIGYWLLAVGYWLLRHWASQPRVRILIILHQIIPIERRRIILSIIPLVDPFSSRLSQELVEETSELSSTPVKSSLAAFHNEHSMLVVIRKVFQ